MHSRLTEHVRSDSAIWLRWTISNAIGFGVAALLLVASISASEALRGPSQPQVLSLVSFLPYALIGFAVGMAQGIALPSVMKANEWVIVTGVGWVLGTSIVAMVPLTSEGMIGSIPLNSLLTVILVAATSIGLLQWAILRRRVLRAWVWIVANPVSWAAGWLISDPVELQLRRVVGAWVPWALVWDGLAGVLAGAIVGGLAGAVLVWLLRRPRANAP